jgi:hypothetical protein
MTISSTNRKAGPFIGNGSASVFAFSFRVFAASDLQVVQVAVTTGIEATLTINSAYTVSLNADQNSNPGGSITLTGGALASGYNLIITSNIANLQPTDLTNQGGFYPEVITDALDRSTIQIQQLEDRIGRSLKYPVTDPALGVELPTVAQRAGKALSFDSVGNPISINLDIPSTVILNGSVEFETIALMTADVSLSYTNVSVGQIIHVRNRDFSYIVLASNASTYHFITAGGVKLNVLPTNGSYNVVAFGAIVTGATDAGTLTANNAALNKAFSAAGSSTGTNLARAVSVQGDFAYTPSAITWPSNTVFEVTGILRPQDGIILNSYQSIIGKGGAPATVQFSRSGACQIVAPPNGDPVISIRGSANHVVKGVVIDGCTVGIVAGGGSMGSLNALMKLEDVSVLSTQPGGIALSIDNVFWLWSTNCVFATTETALLAIKIDNTTRVNGQVGLIYFRDLITSGRGVRMVSPTTLATGEMTGAVFIDWHHENLPDGDTVLDCRNVTQHVSVEGYGNSDPLGFSYDFDTSGCRNFMLRRTGQVRFKSLPTDGIIDGAAAFDYTNKTTEIGTEKGRIVGTFRGALSGRYMARGHMTMMAPGIGTPVNITVPTGALSGDITVASGAIAPDGSSSAYLITPTTPVATGVRIGSDISLSPRAVGAGDFLVLYAMVKSTDRTSGIHTGGGGAINLGLVGATIIPISGGGRSSTEATPIGPDHAIADDGWMPAVCAMQSTAGGTYTPLVSLLLRGGCAGFYLWRPSLRVIPASAGFSITDIHRLMQSFGAMHTAQNGTMAVMDHQPFRTGLAATASRPAASAAGQGAQFFDTTLNKPIWSDGTNWRDAAGTTV